MVHGNPVVSTARGFAVTALFLFMLLLACPGLGSEEKKAENPSQDEIVKQLMKRVEELEAQVKELKAERMPTRPSEKGEAPAPLTYPTLKIGGFSDLTLSGARTGSAGGFSLGQYVLQLNSTLAPRVNFFGEFTASARADAGTGAPAAVGFNPEVERAILRFDHSDQLKISFGRYHTPINWWNTAFHHGLWLQTTTTRPEMTQFGGRFIPVHFIGGLIEGAVPAGGMNLNYGLGLGNGRGSVTSRGGDASDINNNRAWLINLFVKPDRLYGLQVGGSYYHDRINLATGRRFDEEIVSGHIVWAKEDPELIAEYARAHHRELSGGHFVGDAYYVQAAYRLPGYGRRFKPYYRFENMRLSLLDPVYTGTPSTKGSVVGVRYDISDFVALKTEFRNLRRAGSPPFNGVAAQLSFAH